MGRMEMVARGGRKEVNPLLLKLGVALALSFAGFVVSQLRSRPRRRPQIGSSSAGEEMESGGRPTNGGGLKEELGVLKNEEAMAKIINGTSTTTTTTTTTTTILLGLSPTSKSSGDEEGFLLPEFNDLVMKEFEATGKDSETTTPTPKKLELKEETLMEQEIAQLRNLVWSLQERERSLENQLLEYYGMQEQEAAVRELESQLKINTVEAKLYSLKIESLQSENKRLKAQVSDYSRAMDELEAARTKIKLLKKRLMAEGEQAKEKIALLHQRISMLQYREQHVGRDEIDAEEKLKGLKKMEELEVMNMRLEEENVELMRKLESVQMHASSSSHGGREDEALEELDQLRQANEKLTKDIEQLRLDRCADVEELVYLKWVNACLRYELRNYQPPPGKTAARDLSKTLSPRSEEKAKQLILEYANPGAEDKSSSLIEFDSEYSSSQASTGESDDTLTDLSSTTKHSHSSKSKLFRKLKKLILGKETHTHNSKVSLVDRSPSSCSNSEKRISISSCSIDEVGGRDSFCSSMTEESASQNNARHSLDIQRIRGTTVGEVGKPYTYTNMVSREGSSNGFGHNNRLDSDEIERTERVELKKFADALKRSRAPPKLNRRSASFSGC
ncbi:protein CHUP1, chloroplastic isoform X2 [Ananas comosus]|uniref:Protein CHUP1, chloroplastic isoform X2 n=1 Tax=Ananas comosus TaxID=4615 RepID=A0A6P5F6M9_ANACO|nr:protein CHUP1, chloroplastic isoform X2 [Ananas comosus]